MISSTETLFPTSPSADAFPTFPCAQFFQHFVSTALCSLALLVACLAAPPPAQAQLRMEDVTFRANGGTAIPIAPSEFEDEYGAGFSMAAGIGLAVSPSITATLRGSYQRFGVSGGELEVDPFEPELAFGSGAIGGDISSLSGGLDLRYKFSDGQSFTPYLLGGLSAYRFSRAPVTLATSADLPRAELPGAEQDLLGRTVVLDRNQTAFGVSFGLGFQFPISYTAAFFVEPRYTVTFSDPERMHYLPIRAGFVFGEF